MQNEWTLVCQLEDIPRQGARVIQRTGMPDVALFRSVDDQVFALLDRCPHRGGPLSQGMVIGKKVACPLHNWHIQLENGEASAPDVGCARRFNVVVEQALVYLSKTELASLGAE